MEENILQRVKEFCLKSGISVSTFEKRSGLSNGYFSALTKDEIGGRKLRNIAETFPQLSLSWLVMGCGPMLIADMENEGGPLEKQLDEKDRQIDRLLGVIENLSNK